MFAGIYRELRYLIQHKWDLCLVTLAPLLIIILFSSMFAQGKPTHLPIAIIDQDHSELSRNIEKYISKNHSLKIVTTSSDIQEVETLLNKTEIWGYLTIPAGAEQRLVRAQDAEISIVFNQSYFSVGNTISSAMMVSTLQAITDFTGHNYFENILLDLDVPTPHVKVSALYNPSLSYEFYLEPYLIPAILHLLLCCCVAFSIGQEFKFSTTQQLISQQSLFSALVSKNLTYVFIFTLWTWLWMTWLVYIRGWFVAGHVWLIMLGQVLLYSAYAFISSTIVLALNDLNKTFGLIAVYGGSSLSFAGVTLPLNNAPLFTKFWANIIPYTPYAKLQTEQWVIGSPIYISLIPLFILILYVLLYLAMSYLLLLKRLKGVHS